MKRARKASPSEPGRSARESTPGSAPSQVAIFGSWREPLRATGRQSRDSGWWSRWRRRERGYDAASLCRPSHRESYWRLVGAEHWVCGLCHPPVLGLDIERVADLHLHEQVFDEVAVLVEAGVLTFRKPS
jgi:hypothetical protein